MPTRLLWKIRVTPQFQISREKVNEKGSEGIAEKVYGADKSWELLVEWEGWWERLGCLLMSISLFYSAFIDLFLFTFRFWSVVCCVRLLWALILGFHIIYTHIKERDRENKRRRQREGNEWLEITAEQWN